MASPLVAAGTYSKAEARRWFVDADQAIGWAEDRLLGPARSVSSKEIPLERLALAAGLSEDELASLRRSLRRAELNADEVLFREGEPATSSTCWLAGPYRSSSTVAVSNGAS